MNEAPWLNGLRHFTMNPATQVWVQSEVFSRSLAFTHFLLISTLLSEYRLKKVLYSYSNHLLFLKKRKIYWKCCNTATANYIHLYYITTFLWKAAMTLISVLPKLFPHYRIAQNVFVWCGHWNCPSPKLKYIGVWPH